jgi:hypothetical protein
LACSFSSRLPNNQTRSRRHPITEKQLFAARDCSLGAEKARIINPFFTPHVVNDFLIVCRHWLPPVSLIAQHNGGH